MSSKGYSIPKPEQVSVVNFVTKGGARQVMSLDVHWPGATHSLVNVEFKKDDDPMEVFPQQVAVAASSYVPPRTEVTRTT